MNPQDIINNFKSAHPSYQQNNPTSGSNNWLSDVQNGSYRPSMDQVQPPDKSVGFAGTKLIGQTLGTLMEAKPLVSAAKNADFQQNQLDQKLAQGKITQDRYNQETQMAKGSQPNLYNSIPKRTTGDVIRGGVKAGLDIGSLAIAPGGAEGLVGKTLGGAVKQGAIQGAKYGATSGAMSGLGQGVEDNQGVGHTIGQTVKGGLAGGAIGGAVGGALPLAGKAIGRVVNGAPKPTQEDLVKEALSVTQPTLNKKGAVNALQRAGLSGGAQETGRLGNVGLSTSTKDRQVAESVAGIVKKGASPIKNNTAINNEISRISEQEVRPGLKANPKPFNVNQIRSRLNKIEMPTLFKTDPQLEKTYQLVKDTALKEIKNHPQNTEGLWDSRIAIDNAVQKQFGAAIFNPEKSSAIKQAVSDVREAMNGYIKEAHPEFGNQMDQLTNMYEARGRIANTNYKDITQKVNKITRWMKDNPKKAKALGLTGAAIAGDKLFHLLF